MGVVSINPEEMKIADGKIVFTTLPTWHPIKEDMTSFFKLIHEISNVLNGELPTPSETCKLCLYRGHFSSPQPAPAVEDIPF